MKGRLLVADDHALIRRGLSEVVLEHADWSVVEEACDFVELFERVREADFDAIVMDLDMPNGDALDALARLERLCPDTPVLVVSVHPENQFAVRMLRAGASGYLAKDRTAGELMQALQVVVQGRSYVTPELAQQLAGALTSEAQGPPHERLSDREFQVMRAIASGMTVSEVADELQLSVKTVSTYRSRMLNKLEMSSNAEVTRYAIEEGLA